MTLRAIDWMKVATAETIDQGLDEIEKRPIAQIYGPFAKLRFTGERPKPSRVRVSAYSFDEWMDPHAFEDAYDSGQIPREGCMVRLPGGRSLSSERLGLEYLVGYRTPGDMRPPSYAPLEALEQQGLRRYNRRLIQLTSRYQKRYDEAAQSFYFRCEAKIREFQTKLRMAYKQGNQQLIDRYEARIRYWRERYESGSTKGMRNAASKLALLSMPFGADGARKAYIARYINMIDYSSAQRRARWLAQPKLQLVLLPVWHKKSARGVGSLVIKGSGVFSVHGTPGEPGLEQRLDVEVPIDGLLGTPPALEWEIPVDEDKLVKGIRALTQRHLDPEFDFGVSFVELRDVISSVKEVPLVLKSLGRLFKSSIASKYGRSLRAKLITLEGLWSAFRFLSARDLCWKFGTKDVIKFYKNYTTSFNNGFEKTMRQLSALLRENQRIRSKHCVIDRSLESQTTTYPLRDIIRGQLTRYLTSEGRDWPAILEQLTSVVSEDSALVIEKTTSVETRLTVRLKSRLEDELGRAVGDDEALTRAMMSALGLDRWLQILWDLTPYTFVIDWFANVGDVLGELRPGGLHVGYELFGACVSESRTTVTRAYIQNPTSTLGSGTPVRTWNPEIQAFELTSGATVDGRLVAFQPLVDRTYRRNILSAERIRRYAQDWRGQGIQIGNLNAWQLLTGAELLAMRGPDNLSNLTKSRWNHRAK